MDFTHENTFARDFIPPMTTITSGIGLEVLPDLFCLPIRIVNVCFVGDPKETNEFVLVDAGMPDCADVIMNAARERFGQNCKAKAIILTHGHFDHVGSLIELAEAWDVSVYAHRLEMPYVTGKENYPPADSTVDKGLIAKISPMFPNHGIDAGRWVQPLPADGTIHELSGWRWLHTGGHTPGHISLYYEEDKLLFGADTIYKHVFGAEGMYISAPQVSIDPTTAIVSAQRLSKVNFDKLLMAHQDSPLLEGAKEAVEKLVTESIQKLKK